MEATLYTGVLGMRLLKKMDFPDMRFSLYFMGFASEGSIPKDEVERTRWTFSQPATLELTHNWGTEIEPGPSTYHNGIPKDEVERTRWTFSQPATLELTHNG